MPRIRFVVTGRVQGVAFRAHACGAATKLGVTGFVRNRRDGAVEGEAQGEDDALAEFHGWLQGGPSWARVDDVQTEAIAEVEGETSFGVRR